MTQTLYAHMNKIKIKINKFEARLSKVNEIISHRQNANKELEA
jgi:uncharacterized protein YaaN involved in tellurite resistance